MLDLNNNQTKVGLGVVATLALISTTYVFRNNIKSLFTKEVDNTPTELDSNSVESESVENNSEETEKIVNTDE